MGMFDYIKCERALPDGFAGELQTKDFDCDMVTHRITADGRLMLTRIDRRELVPKSERPFPDAAEGTIEEIAGSIRTFTSEHDSHFHGWVRFYGSEGSPNDETWIWHEYRAKFTDGQLVTIELAPDESR